MTQLDGKRPVQTVCQEILNRLLGEVRGFASQNRRWQGKKAQEYWMYFKLF
ncbi:MAG: hypothetical protein HFF18_10300 [Oscillospiraceae bacterium]|nr:hypothetical protein [Oscillospiraceae bacterium]